MTVPSKKFVVAKRNPIASKNIVVEKGDVGVMKSENKDHALVFFIRIWREATAGFIDFLRFCPGLWLG